MKKASFGMGCFWGVQSLFDSVKGVVKTTVGYAGGWTKNPSYEKVCSNSTGHAEAILIEFDEKVISYEELLSLFWKNHDPTQGDRQGPDVGSQYRSVIFYFDSEQKKKALESLEKEQEKYKKKITTEIVKAAEFYPAEEYHQKYNEKRGVKGC